MTEKAFRQILPHVIGIGLGGVLAGILYYGIYVHIVPAVPETPVGGSMTYALIDQSNLLGIATIAAAKAIHKDANVKVVYHLREACSAAKGTDENNWLGGVAVKDPKLAWMVISGETDLSASLCANAMISDYWATSSPYARAALSHLGTQPAFVALRISK